MFFRTITWPMAVVDLGLIFADTSLHAKSNPRKHERERKRTDDSDVEGEIRAVHGTHIGMVKWLAGARNNYFDRWKSLSIINFIDAYSAVHLLTQRWTWLVYVRINCPSRQRKVYCMSRQTSRNCRTHLAIIFNFFVYFFSFAGKAKMIWHLHTLRSVALERTHKLIKTIMWNRCFPCVQSCYFTPYILFLFLCLEIKTFNKAI